MKPLISIFTAAMAAVFLTGCATTMGSRAKQNEALNNQVVALETRVGELDQKLAQLQGQYEALAAGQERQAARAAAAPQKAAALSLRQIQQALKAAGFYEGPIDGKLGPKTKEALKAFQRENGLKPDGVVGNRTNAQLAKYLEGSGKD